MSHFKLSIFCNNTRSMFKLNNGHIFVMPMSRLKVKADLYEVRSGLRWLLFLLCSPPPHHTLQKVSKLTWIMDHVWMMSDLTLPLALLKFWTFKDCHHWLRHMSINSQLFWAILRLCLDYVGALSGLTLLQD